MRGQLLYAARGVVAVSTPQGAWTAPPERAVWIPGGVPHSTRMVGEVSTRSVLIRPGLLPFGERCRVVGVSPLLRSLLVAAAAVAGPAAFLGRLGDGQGVGQHILGRDAGLGEEGRRVFGQAAVRDGVD